MNMLCSLGIHKTVKPLKNRRVDSFLEDTKVCLRCRCLETFDGWRKLSDEDFDKYFNEKYIVALEKSYVYNVLGYRLPFETQVDIVEGMGFDVSEERKVIDLCNDV